MHGNEILNSCFDKNECIGMFAENFHIVLYSRHRTLVAAPTQLTYICAELAHVPNYYSDYFFVKQEAYIF
jgi:hypothetical protein